MPISIMSIQRNIYLLLEWQFIIKKKLPPLLSLFARGLLNILQKFTKITNISGAYFTIDPKMYIHIYIYIITSYNKIIDD
jgi:hypothetical protein